MSKPASKTELPRYIGYAEIAEATGVERHTIQRLIKVGKFPRPDALPTKENRWRLSVILEWLEQRNAQQIARLTDSSVSDPTKLKPDQLVDAHRALAVRLAKAQGVDIDPDAVIGFTYRPTDQEAAAARSELAAQQAALLAAQFNMWGDLFAALDCERAMVVANWLFPALRKQWSETARQTGRAWALPTDAQDAERMAWAALATADEETDPEPSAQSSDVT